MTKRVDWFAHIVDGKFTVPDKDGFLRTIQDAFGTEDQSLSLTVAKSTRSNQQNKYLWAVPYKLLSDHLGYTPEEVHEICKQKFLSHTVHVGDEDMNIAASTAKLPKDEFMDYVARIQVWAAEFDVVIPDPGQA